MVQCGDWPIGVCSWSLGDDAAVLGRLARESGFRHVHLGLDPILDGSFGRTCFHELRNEGWTITATMIAFEQEDYTTLDTIRTTGGIIPEAHWPANRQRVLDAIDLTSDANVPYLEFHFGFIDLGDPQYADRLCHRVSQLADAAAKKHVTLLMETGQETADELRSFLERIDHPAVAVNFDPANMILYGKGDPASAVRTLAGWIKHVHIKDALRSDTTGTWGTEAPFGSGHVDSGRFLSVLKEIGYTGALAIERESGEDRLADILHAVDVLADFQP